jgi:hypothetical protein
MSFAGELARRSRGSAVAKAFPQANQDFAFACFTPDDHQNGELVMRSLIPLVARTSDVRLALNRRSD